MGVCCVKLVKQGLGDGPSKNLREYVSEGKESAPPSKYGKNNSYTSAVIDDMLCILMVNRGGLRIFW